MSQFRVPSPAHSQGNIKKSLKKRTSLSRSTRSVGSPARTTAPGRLSSIILDYKENMNSFALSPFNNRKSILTDNTLIEEPNCKNWWDKLADRSAQNVMEVIQSTKKAEENIVIEDYMDVEVQSQEKKNYTLDLPESSDGESISSIVIPQRKLFTQKHATAQKQFGELIGTRETLAKMNKTNIGHDKTVNAGRKTLFGNNKKNRPVFPYNLLMESPHKSTINKTKGLAATEVKGQVRNLFENRQDVKRKNMFADFIVSDSEDEISDIQPKVFGFQKPQSLARLSSSSHAVRDSSSTHSVTMDLDMEEWNHLPSSTMVDHLISELDVPNIVHQNKVSLSKNNLVYDEEVENDNEQLVQNEQDSLSTEDVNVNVGDHKAEESVEEAENNYEQHAESDNDNEAQGKDENQDEFIKMNLSKNNLVYDEEVENDNEQLVQNEQDSLSTEDVDVNVGDHKAEESVEEAENNYEQHAESDNDNEAQGKDENQDEFIKMNLSKNNLVYDEEVENDNEQLVQNEQDSLSTEDVDVNVGDHKAEESVEEAENNYEQHAESDNDNEAQGKDENQDEFIKMNLSKNNLVYDEEVENDNEQLVQNEQDSLSTEDVDVNVGDHKAEESVEEAENNYEQHAESDNDDEAEESDTEAHNDNEEFSVIEENAETEVVESDEEEEKKAQVEIDSKNSSERPNLTHDTTGRNRMRHDREEVSPEIMRQNITNREESFAARGRNTSIRRKTILKNFSVRQSLPPRDSTGTDTDGTKNSSVEGSGWDSHRTTRKTLRQTFGKDFTPRKSLRALVMEKSAKRQTRLDNPDMDKQMPQANSTELPYSFYAGDSGETETEPIDLEISKKTRQTTLEAYLHKIKLEDMDRKRKMQEAVRNSLKTPLADCTNAFKMPSKPAFAATKRVKKGSERGIKAKVAEMPPEVLQDLQYRPPKRFRASNAAWITQRLYAHLEQRLEPRYDYKARVRAEALVQRLADFARSVRTSSTAPSDAVAELRLEMARLGLVQSHFDFYEFFQVFMPREIRVKVIPDIINKIPLPRRGLFANIIQD